MKILHLSAASEFSGAGKAALLTHKALLNLGISSKLLFFKSENHDRNVFSFHNVNLFNRTYRFIITFLDSLIVKAYLRRKKTIFSPGILGLHLRKNELVQWADIVHIHWANHGFINIHEIEKWNKPVIWTLRDMWAFTGGCHHAFECRKFMSLCFACPALSSKHANDLSKYVFNRKLKTFSKTQIKWIAISSWMKKKAKESKILNRKYIEIIYSGVDKNEYFLLNKSKAKLRLNLPLNKKIILIGANNLREEYKGFSFVLHVLRQMDKDIIVATFGSKTINENEIPQNRIHFGSVNNEKLIQLYNSADLFLGPSIAEAMGKTFVEAQLCGLPVVCFRDTGPEDVVEHKLTGFTAKYKDKLDLLKGVKYCHEKKFDRNYIRKSAVEIFDINKIAKQYLRVYEKSAMDWSDSRSQFNKR